MTATQTKKLELLSDDKFKRKEGVSQTEYAKMRNMTRQNVSKHVISGVITALPNGNIDPESADKQLAENLNPSFTKPNKDTPSSTPTSQQGDKGTDPHDRTFNKARTIEKGYQAKLAELTYNEKVGTLVKAKDVEAAAFDTARKVRDNMLNIPDRIVAQIMSIFSIQGSSDNINKGRTIMVKEIEKALQGI